MNCCLLNCLNGLTVQQTVVTKETHVSCNVCFGFFNKSTFYKHYKTCCQQKEAVIRKPLRICSELLVPSFAGSENLQKNVFRFMFKDKISLVVQSDPLIIKFGSRFLMNHREKHQINCVLSKLRDLAELLMEVKIINNNISGMVDCLAPENFDDLMEAVKNMCSFNKETGLCKTPSVTYRLRSSLISCVDILCLETIKSNALQDSEKKLFTIL